MNFGVRIGTLFMASGFMYSSFLTRMPDVLEQLAVNKATMGLALLGGPLGALAMAPFAGRFINRHSAAWVSVAGIVLSAGTLILLGAVRDWRLFALSLFLFGLCHCLFEIAANSGAERLEVATGRKFMAQCHGFWSLGNMSGALAAGLFAQLGASLTVHLSMIGIGVALASLLTPRILPSEMFAIAETPPPVAKGERRRRLRLPPLAIVGVFAMAFGVTLAEGAVYDWSTVYMRQDIGSDPFWASAAYAVFGVSMALGRFGGDWVRARASAVTIVSGCACLTAVGLIGFVHAPNVVVAGITLALMGVGVSLVMPISIIAAGSKPGDPAENVAMMSMLLTFAFMFAPPGIGFVAEHFGLKAAFLMLLPLVVVSALTAPSARGPNPLSPRHSKG